MMNHTLSATVYI